MQGVTVRDCGCVERQVKQSLARQGSFHDKKSSTVLNNNNENVRNGGCLCGFCRVREREAGEGCYRFRTARCVSSAIRDNEVANSGLPVLHGGQRGPSGRAGEWFMATVWLCGVALQLAFGAHLARVRSAARYYTRSPLKKKKKHFYFYFLYWWRWGEKGLRDVRIFALIGWGLPQWLGGGVCKIKRKKDTKDK